MQGSHTSVLFENGALGATTSLVESTPSLLLRARDNDKNITRTATQCTADFEDDDARSNVSSTDYWECTIIFGMLGCCSAFFWEALLNCLPLICLQLFPESHNLSDRLTAAFNISILIGAFILTVISPLSHLILYSGAASLAVTSVAVALACQIWPHRTSGAIVLGLTCLIAGLGSGFTESATFAYATCLYRTHLSGCFSFGFGVSGIISFVAWLLWTRVLFSEESAFDRTAAVWAQQGLSAIIAILSALAFYRLTRLPSYRVWEARSDSCIGLSDPLLNRDDLSKEGRIDQPMTLIEVVKATGACQFHLGLVLFISYAIVPNLVPMTLNDSRYQRDLLVGVYQVCDFIGRYVANLSGFAPWVAIKQSQLLKMSWSRLVLLGLALIVMYYPEMPAMSSFPVQILFLIICGVTNGWFLTLLMMYLTSPLDHDLDRGRAVAFSVMTQLGGCVGGLLSVNLIKQLSM